VLIEDISKALALKFHGVAKRLHDIADSL